MALTETLVINRRMNIGKEKGKEQEKEKELRPQDLETCLSSDKNTLDLVILLSLCMPLDS